MLYRFIRREYAREHDALVLAVIVRGRYPHRVERRGRRCWVFTAVVDEAGYRDIASCL